MQMSANKVSYNKSCVKQVFDFVLIKQIVLSNNQNYYVIEDAEQNRFLLPLKHYKDYGFEIGEKLQCKLDRVNCKGELFFEPLHGHYTEHSVYEFEYIGCKHIKHVLGFDEKVHVVKDSLGKEHLVPYSNAINNFQNLTKLHLMHIRKGKFLLLPLINEKPIFELNNIYNFKINKSYFTDRLGASFLLIDDFGNKHVLARNNYKKYGFKVGDEIQCKIDGASSKGYFYLEPLHPIYTIGEYYQFEVFNIMVEYNVANCFVIDCYGDIVKLEIPLENANLLPQSQIKCKVVDLTKGKPILEFDSAIGY